MDPIIPTDEQINAIRRADYMDQAHWDAIPQKFHDNMTTILREQYSTPGFQAFLREKMADAWDEGYGDDNECQVPRTNPYRKQ